MSETEKTRTSVEIYGQQYIIVGTERSSHVKKVASMVDEKMREISSKNPLLDINKLAVLTAVNAVNDYLKIKDKLESIEKEIKKVKD